MRYEYGGKRGRHTVKGSDSLSVAVNPTSENDDVRRIQ